MERTCKKCSRTLPIDEFYKHGKGNGRSHKCKACTCDDVQANRRANLDYYHEYDRRRFREQPRRKRAMAQRLRYMRAIGDVKTKARNAVGNAVRDGRLTRKPCEVCGAVKVQAHHDDYSRPLDVRWLCFKHHREVAHGQTVTVSF